MKPTEADIAWCIKNAEFVNGLLEKRGGWQLTDRFIWHDEPSLVDKDSEWYLDALGMNDDDNGLIDTIAELEGYGSGGVVWLPTVGDVLGMVDGRGIRLTLDQPPRGSEWIAVTKVGSGPILRGEGQTLLIALLELLKVVEGKG